MKTMTQAEKGRAFRQLHDRSAAFIIPNPWDIGSARILEHIGFEALATTSMGYAFSLGKLDTTIDRDAMLAHIATIANATSLPVNADLENGYGDDPDTVADTIRLAAAAGVVGRSIEDATGRRRSDLRIGAAVERVRAAVPRPVRCVSVHAHRRAENYLHGRPISTTRSGGSRPSRMPARTCCMRRACSKDDIAAVVKSVQRPVNVLMGLQGVVLSTAELSAIGARRISVGSALYRTAMGAFLRAANEMRQKGTFEFAADAANPRDLARIFKP